jgi:hypothetical protein
MTNDVKDILLHKFYKLMYYPSQKKKKKNQTFITL